MTASLLSSTTSLVLVPGWWPPLTPIFLVGTPTCFTPQFDTAFASSFLEASTCGSELDLFCDHPTACPCDDVRRNTHCGPCFLRQTSKRASARENRKAAFFNSATSLRRSPSTCFPGPLCWRVGRPRSRWHSRGLGLRCDILPTRRLPRPSCRAEPQTWSTRSSNAPSATPASAPTTPRSFSMTTSGASHGLVKAPAPPPTALHATSNVDLTPHISASLHRDSARTNFRRVRVVATTDAPPTTPSSDTEWHPSWGFEDEEAPDVPMPGPQTSVGSARSSRVPTFSPRSCKISARHSARAHILLLSLRLLLLPFLLQRCPISARRWWRMRWET